MTSRFRSKSDQPTDTLYGVLYKGEPSSTTNQNSYFKDHEMDDTVVPNYHARIRAGEIIQNPCVYVTQSRVHSTHTADWRTWENADPEEYWTGDGSGNNTEYMMDFVQPSGLFDNTADDPNTDFVGADSRQKALADVDSTPYDFFEDLMEIRETLLFIRKPLESLKHVMYAFKRKKRKISLMKEGKRKAKALAGLWNQYRFAAAPLVRTIVQAVDVYNDGSKVHRNTRRTAHGHSSTLEEGNIAGLNGIWGSGAWQQRMYYATTSSKSLQIHSAIVYEVTNPIVNWNFKLGLRFKDIPTVAWEILPLSFMVDRLVNIKNMVSGLVNLVDPQVKILSGSLTSRTLKHHSIECYASYFPYGFYTTTIPTPDQLLYEEFEYRREEWSPTWSDTIPPVNWKGMTDSVTKTLDLVSIIISFAL